MIIYNVTVNVDESIHHDWLKWMQNKHINDVLATGLFTNAKMVRVVVEEEMGGTTRRLLPKPRTEITPGRTTSFCR